MFQQITGGAYQARSLLAAAQRCVNLVAEAVPQNINEEPAGTYTYYPRPGKTLVRTLPNSPIRMLYAASSGDLYCVAGQGIYYVDASWNYTLLHTIEVTTTANATPIDTPCFATDNGTTMVLADGTDRGWLIDLATRTVSLISSSTNTGWLGASSLTFQDTFLVASQPNSRNFYCSLSNDTTFDPLDIAAKIGSPDKLSCVVSVQRNLWLLGDSASYEVWQNSGGDGTTAGSFPFSAIPTAYANFGCIAPRSVANTTNDLLWISKDRYGKGLCMHGNGTVAKRVSTHAIENEWLTYPTLTDAIAYIIQMEGHLWYIVSFPSANNYRGSTWTYDLTTTLWSEWLWSDDNGVEWRDRVHVAAYAYGSMVGGDWATGDLYTIDFNELTDAGQAIVRVRSMPHMLSSDNAARITYSQFIANMQVGAATQGPPSQTVVDATFNAADGTLLESYSNGNDVGATFTKQAGSVEGEILSDQVIAETAGTMSYLVGGTPSVADYTASIDVAPKAYNQVPSTGAYACVIVRANGSNNGYMGAIASTGTQFQLKLTVMNTATVHTLNIGTLSSGNFTITLTCQDDSISLACTRSEDNNWVDVSGNWVGSPTTAITITDSTYPGPGRILIGGVWV